jgi:hypothetical protein
MQQRIEQIELELARIRRRNARVASEKAWETSHTRVAWILISTYLLTALVFWLIDVPYPLANALVPTLGYYLSTRSIPFVRRWWLGRQQVPHDETAIPPESTPPSASTPSASTPSTEPDEPSGVAARQEQTMPRHHAPRRRPHRHAVRDWGELPPKIAAVRQQIESTLAGLIGDADEAARICELALDEGPWHRQLTNIALAGMLAARIGTPAPPNPARQLAELHVDLPPHLAESHHGDTVRFNLPTAAIGQLLNEQSAVDETIEAMADGPPHEPAWNVLMLTLIESLNGRSSGGPAAAAGSG